MTSETLSPQQAAALLDILTHAETYQEIRDFRNPSSLEAYGPPFKSASGNPSTSPALQALVSRFILSLPGIKDLTAKTIIEDLEKADLSESYDKGLLGSRKTVATAISALIEHPVRGIFAGFDKGRELRHDYDTSNAEDLSESFRDFMQEAVYGNIVDALVAKSAESDKLTDHTSIVQAVHEYVLVNLASLMHFTLILSPKGQYLLRLVDHANKLVPYAVIRQTLKIGNVASMINAMMKVVLAKVSLASVTNWIGITQSEKDGMNLMQHIISTVLSWDSKELESRAAKLERERAAAGKEQLHALKHYQNKSAEDQQRLRNQSQKESKSIVTVILEDAQLSDQLTDEHHKQALEYLCIQLSIRDRKEIIKVLCHSHPDHLTQAVKELFAAYEPVIRNVHKAVDLSDTLWDFEHFLRDTLKLAKIQTCKDGTSTVPTVGDFVHLLKKHQTSCHKFIHQFCKNGREVTSWYLQWTHTAASHFRRTEEVGSGQRGAGDLTEPLSKAFSELPLEKREKILSILDQECRHLAEMHASSRERLTAVINSPVSSNPAISKIISPVPGAHGVHGVHVGHFSLPGSRSASRHSSRHSSRAPSPDRDGKPDNTPRVVSSPGPGAFLARWQDLLDSTLITPLSAHGPVQHASAREVVNNSAVDVDGEQLVEFEEPERRLVEPHGGKAKRPDVSVVLEAMLPGFRTLLAERSCDW